MQTRPRLLQLASTLYLLGVVLLLVLVIPTSWFPLQIGKIAAFALCAALCGVALILGGGLNRFRLGGGRVALLMAAIPVAYLASYFTSIDRFIGFMGPGFEADTVIFAVLSFIAFLLAWGLSRTQEEGSLLVKVVFFSLIAAALFQCIAIIFGTHAIPFAAFADRSVNLVGKWNDLGLLMGALGIWILMRLQWSPLSKISQALHLALLVVIVILLGLIHFPVVWALLAVFAGILALIAWFMLRGDAKKNVPWYPLAAAVISILFLIFGASINTGLTQVFPVSSVEVRPSYSANMSVTQAAHSSAVRTLLGTGPNTFQEEWMRYKPIEVNLSQFWGIDFNVGYSTLLTAYSDVGILGALAYLIAFVITLLALLRVFRSGEFSEEQKMTITTLGMAALYLWVAAGLYVLSQNLILLAFILTGALVGLSFRRVAGEPSRSSQMVSLILSILVVLASLYIAFGAGKLLLSQSYTGQGLSALNSGQVDQALAKALQAERFGPNADALRLEEQAGLAKLQVLAQATSSSQTATTQKQFLDLAPQIIQAGNQAIALSPNDYRSYAFLGQVYDFLSSLSVQNSYGLAQSAYAKAAEVNPTNPQIPLLQARLEAAHNNAHGTQQFLKQSLTLKQNYTDAILFVVQLEVAQKNLQGAVQAAQAAVQTAPGVAPIWFELGLLYYSGNDTKDAIPVLEQAIKLQSNYANAKYFLGLAYYAQGRSADAIAQFQDLQRTNPDNQEVALILANMQAGKPPFTAAQPPVTTPPQNRATAPISQ